MKRAKGFTLIELMVVIALLGILVMLLQGTAQAAGRNFDNAAIWNSSWVSCNHAGAYISDSKYFHGVVVSSASAAGSLMKVYDSTWTTTGQIGCIDLGEKGTYPFDAWLTNGLFYVITGVGAKNSGSGATIQWRKTW